MFDFDNIVKKDNEEDRGVKLAPINLCKRGIGGGSECSEKGNFEKQKTCYFFRKKDNEKNCDFCRIEINFCDNHLAWKKGN